MTGSAKLFANPKHVGSPNLGDRDRLLARFDDILDCRWLTNDGKYVRAFEQQVAEFLDVKHCVAVCNATIGLQLVIRALGLHGEVIVPSFTFPATVHALAWQGIRPVFCDVDAKSHNIDPAAAEKLVTSRTSGILGVHLWGNPCAIESLNSLAKRHRLALLFDAAHAFGCAHGNRMIGNFGSAEVFSFHATKFLSTGEGGAITTNDDELANELRRLRNFGIEDGQVAGIGINGKMDEFSAAMGVTALESRDDFIARNHTNLAAYEHALTGAAGLRLCVEATPDARNRQYIVVEVNPAEARISRDDLVTALHAENVLAKRYFFPGCHRLEPYRSMDGASHAFLPNTERLCERLIQLPTGTSVSEGDIARIGDFLRRLVGAHGAPHRFEIMDDFKASVCMITYNHERYIAQAVESALAQQTTFPFEIVIGEDGSTDRTPKILCELARKHPEKIKLRLAERNQGVSSNFLGTFATCRGQYVAMLEGDDYWSCTNKLQMQVDALDAHPEWAICFHPAACVYEDGMQGVPVYPMGWTKPEATIEDLLACNFLATASVVFRNRLFPEFPQWFKDITLGDWPLHILNATYGHIGFLPEVMSAYRIHQGGLWTGTSLDARLVAVFNMLSAIDHHFAGKYTDAINLYRANAIRGVIGELDAVKSRVGNVAAQLRRVRSHAEAQTHSQAQEHIQSSCLEVDLATIQNHWHQFVSDFVVLEENFATLTEENRRLQAFHDRWTNTISYRLRREIRRPFQKLGRFLQRMGSGSQELELARETTISKAA